MKSGKQNILNGGTSNTVDTMGSMILFVQNEEVKILEEMKLHIYAPDFFHVSSKETFGRFIVQIV